MLLSVWARREKSFLHIFILIFIFILNLHFFLLRWLELQCSDNVSVFLLLLLEWLKFLYRNIFEVSSWSLPDKKCFSSKELKKIFGPKKYLFIICNLATVFWGTTWREVFKGMILFALLILNESRGMLEKCLFKKWKIPNLNNDAMDFV